MTIPIPCPLTPRELAVLRVVAATGAQKTAARQLGVSQHTVKNHIDTVNHKLATCSVVTSAVWAVERGWLSNVTTGTEGGKP